jgi:hypothetical protein
VDHRDQEKLEKARIRVSIMLTLASELGGVIGPADIRRAPIAKLSPIAERSACVAANLVLVVIEQIAFTLAGLADDQALEALEARVAEFVPPTALTQDMSPRANPRAARHAASSLLDDCLEGTMAPNGIRRVINRVGVSADVAREVRALAKAGTTHAALGRRFHISLEIVARLAPRPADPFIYHQPTGSSAPTHEMAPAEAADTKSSGFISAIPLARPHRDPCTCTA